jgi:endonuclease/exonuclease/phosphatase family metal-dependent hydrolase
MEVKLQHNCASCVWCKVPLTASDYLLVGVIYRSPSSDACYNQMLNEVIREAVSMKSSHILLLGDFNFPEISWCNQSCAATAGHPLHKFLDCVHDCFLFQHVTEATHFCGSQRANVLDLIFTYDEAMISDLHYDKPIGKSDHVVLSCQYNVHKAELASQFVKYC